MEPAILLVIVFFTIVVWRLMFTCLLRPLVREATAPEQQHNNILQQGLHILVQNDSDGGNCNAGQQAAEAYLRRVVALTGATQMGSSYTLDVGKTRFHVRDRNVRRIPDGEDPIWGRCETCFHPAYQEMAAEEQIATVLLQLKSNPWLFENWAVKHELAFKADGRRFNRPKFRARDENTKQIHTGSAGSQIP
jgi:hypothetical protein